MGLFTTEGILRKKNLRDVPKPVDGLSNILKAAFDNKMDAADIKIIDGAETYGAPFIDYYYTREYLRLKNVLIRDINRPRTSAFEYPVAQPLQTINNRLDVATSELGEKFPTGGGDGLKIEYFNWNDVYSAELDIKSEGGGSYVEGQELSSSKVGTESAQLDQAYASPNTFVAPTDSEAFFEFDSDDLVGKNPTATEKGWNKGIFNFGSRPFHPTISNSYGAGVVKLSGYFNTSFSATNAGIETGFNIDRLNIVSRSSRYNSEAIPYAGTSIPTIIKIWEVDQVTGERLTSNQSPLSIARYAPGYEVRSTASEDSEADTGQVEESGGRENSPYIYKFSSINFGGINDQLYKTTLGSDFFSEGISIRNVGPSYLISGKIDGSPRLTANPNAGNPGSTLKQKIIPFKENQFHAIEIYFILSPRATLLLGDQNRCAMIEAFELINNRSLPVDDSFFWSENPLASFKGNIYEAIEDSIPNYGSSVSGNVSPLGSNSPNFKLHQNPIGSPGGDSITDYTQFFSGQKIIIDYKPPRTWKDILVVRNTISTNFGKQFTQPQKYTDVLYMAESGNAGKIQPGNLVIDAESPRPRKGQDYDVSPSGSVFAPFTYIANRPRHKEYLPLSKPTIRYKNHIVNGTDGVPCHIIDHKGIKGYGRGRLILNSTGGPYGNAIAELDIGNQDCPHQFYIGESMSAKDIIIFEDYGEFAPVSNTPNFESPFLQVYDSPDAGGRIKITQLASNGFKPEVTNFIDNSSDRDFGENRIKDHSDSNSVSLFPFNSIDDTPGGRNFFVYRHRGLVDDSLDGFCSLTTGAKVFEALVAADITQDDSPRISIQRNSITSYDGDNIVNPLLAVDANSPDIGILGQVADYNGPASPSGDKAPIINKVFDHKFADTITISGFDGGYVTYNGTYQHDCIEYKPQDDIPHYYDTYKSEYGNPKPGDQFYFLQGQADRKIRFRHDNGKWELLANDGSVVAEYVSENVPFPGGSNISLTLVGAATGTPIIGNHISRNSPTAPFSFLLTHPNTPSGGAFEQSLTQDLKRGFGITIALTGANASTQYQCFKPTDTAPPFRATADGIRSIPEEPFFRSSVRIGTANHSPDASFKGDTITSISVSEIRVIGAYGDNSPGINGSNATSHARMTSQSDFTAGGVISLDATNPATTYNRRILFDFIPPEDQSSIQTYSILASSTHVAASP